MKASSSLNRRVSVAPMMGWTDRYDRYFLRLISPNVLLYTVMITTGALIYGKKFEVLEYSPEEHPIALQLGGSDPGELAECAKLAEQYGYDEVNLNCGCPSPRVQKGNFGACLMAEPALVADCIDAMQQVVSIPVTVKTRIGIDDQDSYEFLTDFVAPIAAKGCKTFIIHARKALLNGLSPADNRSIPPLQYDTAYRLKKDFPDLNIILNGGLKTIGDIQNALSHLDGVMIGREAYTNPWFLTEIEQAIFDAAVTPTRLEIIEKLMPYIESCLAEGVPLKNITRHILGLWQGMPGARKWRRILSEEAYKPVANINVVWQALQEVR
jgi:tRNA-dihydrouridine synthase A